MKLLVASILAVALCGSAVAQDSIVGAHVGPIGAGVGVDHDGDYHRDHHVIGAHVGPIGAGVGWRHHHHRRCWVRHDHRVCRWY